MLLSHFLGTTVPRRRCSTSNGEGVVAMRRGWARVFSRGRASWNRGAHTWPLGWAPQHSHAPLQSAMGGPELFTIEMSGLGLLLSLALPLPHLVHLPGGGGGAKPLRGQECLLLFFLTTRPPPRHPAIQWTKIGLKKYQPDVGSICPPAIYSPHPRPTTSPALPRILL